MKILVLSFDGYPFNKPTAKLSYKILNNLSQKGYYFDIISKGNYPTLQISEGITNYFIKNYDEQKTNRLISFLYKCFSALLNILSDFKS